MDWRDEQRAMWRWERWQERMLRVASGMFNILALAVGSGFLLGITLAVAIWVARALT